MKEKWDIIYIGNEYSTDNRTSSHHIAHRLSENHNLLYIEASGLRKPRATGSDFGKIFRRIKKLFSPLKKLENGLRIKSLFILPFPELFFVPWFNKVFTLFTIRRVSKKLGIGNSPIIWCTVPTLANIIEELNPLAIVYYCVDDFSALPGVDVKHIVDLDHNLSTIANVIFTPSIPLYEKKMANYSNVQLSPHGVDVDHFSQANELGEIPDDIADIRGSVIGFFGLIEHWIDIELVCFLARKLPHITVIMIGRVTINLNSFDVPRNVLFLGQRPYESLPDYARRFDVAIIPYVLNQQVFNSNPLKLREYLATGKPIVSVSCPEIDKYGHVVSIAKDYPHFIQLVEDSLTDKSQDNSALRISSISDETWEARYEKVCYLVDEAINKKRKLN